jgi:hypothetical protein
MIDTGIIGGGHHQSKAGWASETSPRSGASGGDADELCAKVEQLTVNAKGERAQHRREVDDLKDKIARYQKERTNALRDTRKPRRPTVIRPEKPRRPTVTKPRRYNFGVDNLDESLRFPRRNRHDSQGSAPRAGLWAAVSALVVQHG